MTRTTKLNEIWNPIYIPAVEIAVSVSAHPVQINGTGLGSPHTKVGKFHVGRLPCTLAIVGAGGEFEHDSQAVRGPFASLECILQHPDPMGTPESLRFPESRLKVSNVTDCVGLLAAGTVGSAETLGLRQPQGGHLRA